MENFSDDIKRKRAIKKVRAIRGFYKHFAVYVIVNIVLITIKFYKLDPGEHFLEFNTFSTPLFWGIGLILHAFSTFGTDVLFGNNWEERKIRQIMDKDAVSKDKWE